MYLHILIARNNYATITNGKLHLLITDFNYIKDLDAYFRKRLVFHRVTFRTMRVILFDSLGAQYIRSSDSLNFYFSS